MAVKWEIRQRLAVLSTNENSKWTKEANLVSWNDGPEKLDIRDWSPTHEKMGKGITPTSEETKALGKALANLSRR